MKKPILLILFLLFVFNSNAQETVKQTDWSYMKMNYIFSRLNTETITNKTLFDGALYVKVFSISDSKITPENFSEGTEEFLESLLVSISPDGDAYTESKLIKLEGLTFPEIKEFKESKYPSFSMIIEVGPKENRKEITIKL